VPNNWSVIGNAWNEESQEMVEYIHKKTGVEPKFFALYSTMMAFIRHAGINENRPVAYRNGHYMGDFDNIKRLLHNQ
jgi:hypothetical protein